MTTLAQWAADARVFPTHPTTEHGAVSVVIHHTHPLRRELWRLADYCVSTVSGPVVWLTPRRQAITVGSVWLSDTGREYEVTAYRDKDDNCPIAKADVKRLHDGEMYTWAADTLTQTTMRRVR